VGRVVIDPESLLVKPDVASAQLEAEHQPVTPTPTGHSPTATGAGGQTPTSTGVTIPETTTVTPPVLQLRRFHGSVRLDPLRLGRDASRITDEVVQHLSGLVGADVQITPDIQAELPQSASDKLVRDVTENCRTLKFDDYGFEES
jgi:hypothetical protein